MDVSDQLYRYKSPPPCINSTPYPLLRRLEGLEKTENPPFRPGIKPRTPSHSVGGLPITLRSPLLRVTKKLMKTFSHQQLLFVDIKRHVVEVPIKLLFSARSEVLTAPLLKNRVFWYVTLRRSATTSWRS